MPDSTIGAGFEPGDVLGDEDALGEAAVRELQPGDDVAHGVDAVDGGAAALVGDDEAAVERDAGLLVAQPVGDRAAADGDEQQVGDELVAALEVHRHGVEPSCVRRLEPHAGAERDAALAERALQGRAHGGVLRGDEPGQRLDDGHLGAERAHDGGELDPDDAAAEHDDALGHGIERQRLVAGHDRPADLETGQGAGVGPGGEHDVPADEPSVADDDGAVALEPAGALDVVDLARRHQPLQSLVQPARPRPRGRP